MVMYGKRETIEKQNYWLAAVGMGVAMIVWAVCCVAAAVSVGAVSSSCAHQPLV